MLLLAQMLVHWPEWLKLVISGHLRRQRPRRCGEPCSCRLVHQWSDDLVHARVVVVEPDALLRRQDPRLDQTLVNRRERQRLELIEGLFGANWLGRGDHKDQVFDANAVSCCLVVAGLVRQDHAPPQGDSPQFRYPCWAFVHRQITSYAMPGAVVEIESGLP